MKILSSIIIIIFAFTLTSGIDERLFQINKNFEIYGAIFRELNESYLIEVDPDNLMNDGIKGMLKKLDPYTEFFSEDNRDRIDVLTNGSYVGFGITVSRIDNEMYVSDFAEDFIAFDSGLRVGDKLYKIDTTVVINKNSNELKPFTQGKIGSIADVTVIREQDTLELKLERHKVDVSDVSYYGVVKGSIGYIKLDRFTKQSGEEFERAFLNLKQTYKINAIIIDLRDNPGGLLQSAFKICSIFLPKGSLIVSTKGRKSSKNYDYKSGTAPIDTEIPIAVLINENSASASEIVAGCFQDHDRGIILGNTSYGKGLVQTVARLPYNSKLKLTTSRYYTPSGRSIQGIDYYKLFEADTNVFYTNAGRKVNEHNGIEPDSLFKDREYSDFVTDIYNKKYFFWFGNKYAYENEEVPADFKVSDQLIDEFKQYILDDAYVYQTKAISNIDDLYIQANLHDLGEKVTPLLDSLTSMFKKDLNKLIDKNRDDITLLMQYELLRRFHNANTLTDIFKDSDSLIIKTNDILLSNQYDNILSGNSKLDKNH